MEENQYIIEFPDGFSKGFPTKEEADEWLESQKGRVAEREHGRVGGNKRPIAPGDSDEEHSW